MSEQYQSNFAKRSYMEKRYGATERNDRLMQIGRNKWELIFGYGTDGEIGWDWRERFALRPTLDEIKSIITLQINTNIREKIQNGFQWIGKTVYLSTENQLNYGAIERNDSIVYPLDVKINEDETGVAVYHRFATKEEFTEFSQAASLFIIETVQKGWREKDGVDWTKYLMP